MENRGETIVYEAADGNGTVPIDVRMEDETVWLSLNQMAALFGRDNSVVSGHLRNVFQTGEFERERTVAKYATVQSEGGREIEFYNLDAIISVGYRVNSKRGTQFRIWSTRVLRDHLVRGFSINEKRLAEKGAGELRQVVSLLSNTLNSHPGGPDPAYRRERTRPKEDSGAVDCQSC